MGSLDDSKSVSLCSAPSTSSTAEDLDQLSIVGSSVGYAETDLVKDAVTRVISTGGDWKADTNRKCAIILRSSKAVQEVDQRIPLLANVQDGIDHGFQAWFYTSIRRKERKDGRPWIGDVLIVAYQDPAASSGPPKKGIKFDSSEQVPQDFKDNFPNVVVNYGYNPFLRIRARKYQLLGTKVCVGLCDLGSPFGGFPSTNVAADACGAADMDDLLEDLVTLDNPVFADLNELYEACSDADLRTEIHNFFAAQPSAEMRRRKFDVIADAFHQFERGEKLNQIPKRGRKTLEAAKSSREATFV